LWDVVVNVDGEDYFTNCLIGLQPCTAHDSTKPFCPIHFKYQEMREKIEEFYKATTLKQVADDIEKFEDLVRL
jgi:DNA-binding IscR family transcriptional regulator